MQQAKAAFCTHMLKGGVLSHCWQTRDRHAKRPAERAERALCRCGASSVPAPSLNKVIRGVEKRLLVALQEQEWLRHRRMVS